MRDYSLSAILSDKTDQNTDDDCIEILDSTKSYDVKDFLNALQNRKTISIEKSYYGKLPELINEEGINWNEKLNHSPLQYCPVGIVLDTGILYDKNRINDIYPFDPQIIRNEDINQDYFRLSFSEMKQYIKLFYRNNKCYLEEKYIEIRSTDTIIEFLNNLHNPEHYGNFSKKHFEPKRTAITFLLNDLNLSINLMENYPELIKLIIIPEKIKEYTIIKEIMEFLPYEGCITYKTESFHEPSVYNLTVEQIFKDYIRRSIYEKE